MRLSLARAQALALLLLVLAPTPARAAEGWVTAKDDASLAQASRAVGLYCAGGFKGDLDREGGRAALEAAVGGENAIEEILAGAKDSSEVSSRASETLTPAWFIAKVGSVIFAFILILLWFFCCWSACPCCKCCRCGSGKERQTHKITKVLLLFLGGSLTFGIIFAAAYGRAGYGKCVDGFDNMACTAAKLVKGTLGGQDDPHFIGMMPLLEEFQALEQSLASDSSMMAAVRQELNATSEVADAMYLASQTLRLLRDALTTNFPAVVDTNHHECRLCQTLAPVLDEISGALDAGAASTLAAARAEIDTQLSPENSAKLQDTFRSAGAPIVDVKVLIRDTFSVFTDTDKFLQIRGHLDGDGPNTVSHLTMSVVLFGVLIVACMGCSCFAFVFRERAGKPKEDGGPKPYSKIPHRCSCCTWCWGWLFMVFAFLIGGLMNIISVPLSGICLIMDDLSADLLQSVGPGLGVNLTGDAGQQLLDIVSNCLVPADPTLNAKLLDLVYVRDNATAPRETLNEKIVEKVKTQIRSKFDDIDSVVGGGADVSLSGSSEVLNLRRLLENNAMSMLILAKSTELPNNPTFQDMYGSAALTAPSLVSSAQCPDSTVSAEVDGLAGETVYGVDAFVTALETFGARSVLRADCADLVICIDPLGTPRRRICEAGNEFVRLKQRIMDTTTFRCDLFELDNGAVCDVMDMTGVYDESSLRTQWSGDCLNSGNKLVRKPILCNIDQFNAYVQEFSARINTTLNRVDLAVTEVGPSISNGLRNVVEDNLIAPIDRIASGVTCGLMGSFYREMVDGFCYQGARGFIMLAESYVSCGALAVVAVVIMYAVWRRAVDNVNKTTPKKAKTHAAEIVIGQVSVVPSK